MLTCQLYIFIYCAKKCITHIINKIKNDLKVLKLDNSDRKCNNRVRMRTKHLFHGSGPVSPFLFFLLFDASFVLFCCLFDGV